MNYNFADYIREGWLIIYMDDLTIRAESQEDEEWKVHLVLQQFCNLRLSLKLSKCEFSKTEVKFLDMIVGCGCIIWTLPSCLPLQPGLHSKLLKLSNPSWVFVTFTADSSLIFPTQLPPSLP